MVLASVAIALTVTMFKSHLGEDQLKELDAIGGVVGTFVSVLFMFAIAIMKRFILIRVYRALACVKAALSGHNLHRLIKEDRSAICGYEII